MSSATHCLTGSETTADALARRLGAPADLHEVRLDLLEEIDDSAFALLQRHGPRLLVTCRAATEGGGFAGAEADRLEVLARAARCGVAWLDLELFLFEQGALSRLGLGDLPDPPRLVASLHDFEGGPGLAGELARRFDGCPADVAKLAVAVRGADDLAGLRRLDLGCALRVVVGMGEAGVWSRMRPADFGSHWTYLTTTTDRATAPGQLTEEVARSMRLDRHEELAPLALVGGHGIRRSPGPRVHNALLEELDLPYQYLPLPSDEAPRRAALADLGVAGMSVAAPHTGAMASACQNLDTWARRCASVNTIQCLDDGRWNGFNTDAPAVLSLLGDAVRAGDRVLVLGAGATARAAATALTSAGAQVSLAARHPGRAAGSRWDVVDLEDAARFEADVLLNCTPLGGEETAEPWPFAPEARVVLDTVLRPQGATPLVERARDHGCLTFTGHQLWCHQAALQMSHLLAREITPEALMHHLEAAGWEI